MAEHDLEPDLEALYAGPLDRFVAARNELAARLRKEGSGEASARIKALAKPSVSAWAVNQLHREHPHLFEALLDAGADLCEAQRDALDGHGGESLREATRAQRAEISKLADAAREVLERAGHPATQATLDRVAATLQAVAAGGWPGGAAGRLAHDLTPPGFDALADLLASSPAAPRPKRAVEAAPEPEAQAAEDPRKVAERAEAQAAVAQAKRALEAARREAERSEVARARAAERAETSRRHAEDAAREAAAASDRSAAAERAATEAAAEVERTAAAVERAASEVVAAEAALAKLTDQAPD